MKYARAIAAVMALAAIAAYPAAAMTPAFEDNKLNYRSCDGENVTARWRGSLFSLSLPGKSLGDAHEAISYSTWDGQCLTGKWNVEAAQFRVEGADAGGADGLLGYVSWDGSKWAGVRAGDGFFVAKIAEPDEAITNDHLARVAAWLEKRNLPYEPGGKLAAKLKEAAAP